MIAYTQSLPSAFVKQLHTKARIRTKAGGCGVEPHTQTALGQPAASPRRHPKIRVVPPSETTTRQLKTEKTVTQDDHTVEKTKKK